MHTRISVLMDRLGWKQPEMADYLGCRQASVSRMVNGQPESGPVQRLLDILARERGHADLVADSLRAGSAEAAE